MLREYPQFDIALIHTIESARELIQKEIRSKYLNPALLPFDKRLQLIEWGTEKEKALHQLRDLGWRTKGKIGN